MLFLPGMHRGANPFRGPLRLVTQQVGRQLDGALQPDTAVTQITGELVEEIPGRRVVQVDVVPVGEQELYEPQRVAGPRLLAELEVALIGGIVPVDGGGAYHF